ncbi:hypothetical protein MYP_679 [Sporocytophaga myxococcoides]|uniref:Uncharacterized protein n=1 Tax=Sporocytophaga myxococcoides TaxID=153721 RepID=A0A098LAJ0_9BACT|nr:hypothetical protein [Sporocytophaga myxococcoides]GAL83452.1 hypothetical protein MYP_679 [Sporocytophaga myxococcoides]
MTVFFVDNTPDEPFRIIEGKVIKSFPEYRGSYECEGAHNCRIVQIVEYINPDGVSKSRKRLYETLTFKSIHNLEIYYKSLLEDACCKKMYPYW